MKNQYQRISSEKIQDAEEDPQRVLLMMMANRTLQNAEEQAVGEKFHSPAFHKSGWSMAIETSNGVVGLWSCWLENRFYLGYPKRTSFIVSDLLPKTVIEVANSYCRESFSHYQNEVFDYERSKQFLISFETGELISLLQQNEVDIPASRDNACVFDDLIMDALEVKLARPVRSDNFGTRQWSKFYGPKFSCSRGRVWIGEGDRSSNSHQFETITLTGELESISYGHDYSRGVWTEEFSFFSESQPEAPNATPGAIQPYRDKFLTLMCGVAQVMGGATAVNINYGFVLVPEDLERLGYENITWLKGSPGIREGWGKEMVRAEKNTEQGKETVILKSGNSLVPWSTIRRVPCSSALDSEQLLELLTF